MFFIQRFLTFFLTFFILEVKGFYVYALGHVIETKFHASLSVTKKDLLIMSTV